MAETVLPQAMIDTVTLAADWVVVLPLILCLFGTAATLMARKTPGLSFVLTITLIVAAIACNIALLLRVYESGPISMTMGKWLPPFGISFSVDLFGAAFALAAAVVTLVVIVYVQGQRDEDADGSLHPLVLLLLAGVTGSFLTGDLFNLYVWFEVMLIASFGLMVLGGRPLQLDAAVKYGFLNFLATSFFLLALGLTYGLLGTLNMADMLRVAPAAPPAAMAAIAALLLLAFGMKAAAFPVNAWLPAAYHAPPAAVSALFAGLLTKVGAYALMRSLVVILPDSRDLLEPVLIMLATLTLLIAPLGAIAETNLRRAIGFLVIGGVGAILAGIALPSLLGVGGAGLYVFHAILTMTALYLVAGLIETATGATDTRQMGGLYAATAPISILFLVLILATAGVPPLLGFWPKVLLLQAGLADGGWGGTLLVAALLINAVLTLIAGSRLWAHVFLRAAPDNRPINALARTSLGATIVLAAIIVAAGLWPNGLFEALAAGAPDLIDPARYVDAVGLAGAAP